MTKFSKEVDLTSEESMKDFLLGHFKYSERYEQKKYAHCVKISCLDLPSKEVRDNMYDMVEMDDFVEQLNHYMKYEFDEKYNYNYQIGWAGRSGGYLILLKGGLKDSGYKTRCSECFFKTYKEFNPDGPNICPNCNKDSLEPFSRMVPFTTSGWLEDENDEFEDWTIPMLKDRVELVQDFDKCCDGVLDLAISIAENYEVKDEEYTVTKTRKVLVEK